jgi:hypothetical protein
VFIDDLNEEEIKDTEHITQLLTAGEGTTEPY